MVAAGEIGRGALIRFQNPEEDNWRADPRVAGSPVYFDAASSRMASTSIFTFG
jgi:hypothetical protein